MQADLHLLALACNRHRSCGGVKAGLRHGVGICVVFQLIDARLTGDCRLPRNLDRRALRREEGHNGLRLRALPEEARCASSRHACKRAAKKADERLFREFAARDGRYLVRLLRVCADGLGIGRVQIIAAQNAVRRAGFFRADQRADSFDARISRRNFAAVEASCHRACVASAVTELADHAADVGLAAGDATRVKAVLDQIVICKTGNAADIALRAGDAALIIAGRKHRAVMADNAADPVRALHTCGIHAVFNRAAVRALAEHTADIADRRAVDRALVAAAADHRRG